MIPAYIFYYYKSVTAAPVEKAHTSCRVVWNTEFPTSQRIYCMCWHRVACTKPNTWEMWKCMVRVFPHSVGRAIYPKQVPYYLPCSNRIHWRCLRHPEVLDAHTKNGNLIQLLRNHPGRIFNPHKSFVCEIVVMCSLIKISFSPQRHTSSPRDYKMLLIRGGRVGISDLFKYDDVCDFCCDSRRMFSGRCFGLPLKSKPP